MGGSDIPKMKNVHIWNIFHVRLPPLGFSGTPSLPIRFFGSYSETLNNEYIERIYQMSS